MLFHRSLWKSKYYFLTATAILLIASSVWKPQYILVTPGHTGFFSTSEQLIPFVVLLPISFLLYDNYEIELALINGVTTMKLTLYKFLSTVIATLLPMGITILLLRQKAFFAREEEIFIPLEIPTYYKVYLLLSAFVTVSFFASLFLFLRVVLRNCYAPVGIAILVYSLFESRTSSIQTLSIPFRNALFDPFVTRYLIGDKVVNEGFAVSATGEIVDSLPHLWTFNRLLFLGLAVLLLAITCLLLRRERLHESFGN